MTDIIDKKVISTILNELEEKKDMHIKAMIQYRKDFFKAYENADSDEEVEDWEETYLIESEKERAMARAVKETEEIIIQIARENGLW